MKKVAERMDVPHIDPNVTQDGGELAKIVGKELNVVSESHLTLVTFTIFNSNGAVLVTDQ